MDPWAHKGQEIPSQGPLAKGSSAKAGVPGLTCCSSNSEEKRWVTDKISREKEKEPPPYLGEQKCAEPGGGTGEGTVPPQGARADRVPPAPRGTHWVKSVLQLPRMKSQARDCPTTLLAMLLIVEVASCFRIFVGSSVYCRYLEGHNEVVRGWQGQWT